MERLTINMQEICPTTNEICPIRSDLVNRVYVEHLAVANLKKSPRRIYKNGYTGQELIKYHKAAERRINSILDTTRSCDQSCAVWQRLLELTIYPIEESSTES